jgi:hypothetical protein
MSKKEPLLKYTPNNLKIVCKSIQKNLTPDLIPKKYRLDNKRNKYYGHCHTASACLYLIFRSKNMNLYRVLDAKTSEKLKENFWHWWIFDKNTQKIIDLTSRQYKKQELTKLYRLGEKTGYLGFGYIKKSKLVLEKVRKELKF